MHDHEKDGARLSSLVRRLVSESQRLQSVVKRAHALKKPSSPVAGPREEGASAMARVGALREGMGRVRVAVERAGSVWKQRERAHLHRWRRLAVVRGRIAAGDRAMRRVVADCTAERSVEGLLAAAAEGGRLEVEQKDALIVRLLEYCNESQRQLASTEGELVAAYELVRTKLTVDELCSVPHEERDGRALASFRSELDLLCRIGTQPDEALLVAVQPGDCERGPADGPSG